jgi:hypothetical protein
VAPEDNDNIVERVAGATAIIGLGGARRFR